MFACTRHVKATNEERVSDRDFSIICELIRFQLVCVKLAGLAGRYCTVRGFLQAEASDFIAESDDAMDVDKEDEEGDEDEEDYNTFTFFWRPQVAVDTTNLQTDGVSILWLRDNVYSVSVSFTEEEMQANEDLRPLFAEMMLPTEGGV